MEAERLCEITIEIGGYKKDKEKELIKACMVEWAFREDDFFKKPPNDKREKLLEASALGTLSDGEDANEIAQRLERAVWRINGCICHVKVHAVCMNKPSETYQQEQICA